jgi:phytoene dehydrogenase-like protein
MSPAARYDAVVVGGGHNGLTAAAYLARAGWSVLVLERRDVLGGAAISSQVFPGVDVRLSAYSYLVSLLPDRIVTDLGLPIALLDRAVASCTPVQRAGRPGGLLVERDEGPATAASFRALTGSDEELAGWRRFYARLAVLAEDLAPTLTEPLPSAAALEARLRDPGIWRDLRERPLADVVADHLSDDDVRGVALTDGLIGTFADVHAADGPAGRCFLYHLVGNGTGRWRVPVGGMGAVSGALATAARAAGAELVTGADVRALETRPDGVTVHWTDRDGTLHAADGGYAVSGAAPAVLDALLGSTPTARPSGSQLKVNMVLRRLPGLRSGADPHQVFSGTVHVDEAASQLDAAYRQAAAGQLPDVVPFEVYCHSLTDASIVGDTGLHTLTLFGLHTPAELYATDPAGTRDEAVRRVVAQLDAHLTEPLADCLARDADGQPCLQASSPLDVEAALAMPGGHIFHGDLSWPVAAGPADEGSWGVATAHPRVVAASSGGTVRGGAVSGLGGFAAAQHLLGRT